MRIKLTLPDSKEQKNYLKQPEGAVYLVENNTGFGDYFEIASKENNTWFYFPCNQVSQAEWIHAITLFEDLKNGLEVYAHYSGKSYKSYGKLIDRIETYNKPYKNQEVDPTLYSVIKDYGIF